MRRNSSLFSRAHISALLAGVVILASACGSTYQRYDEAFIRTGIHGDPSAPEWVQGEIPQDAETIYFVGRSIGYDVLDERGAYDAATAHARQQAAEFMATRVSSKMTEVDDSDGVRYLPRPAAPGTPEALHQELTERVCQFAEAYVGDLVAESQYWEQWDIREKPEKHLYPYNHRGRRYKLWVLMSISRDAMSRRADETMIALRNDAALEEANEQLAIAMSQIAAIGEELDQTAYERETLADLVRNGKRYSVQGNNGCTAACGGLNGNCRTFHVTGRPAIRVFNGPVGCASDIAATRSQTAVVLQHVNNDAFCADNR